MFNRHLKSLRLFKFFTITYTRGQNYKLIKPIKIKATYQINSLLITSYIDQWNCLPLQ